MKIIIILLIMPLFFTTAACCSISSDNIYFDKEFFSLKNSNTILYVGGNGPNNYTWIQDAINDSSNGDTVFVFNHSSPYKENLIVNKTIRLIGENKESTIIDGNGKGDVVLILSDNVNISGFTIRNGGLIFPDGGINVRANHTTINGNNMINNFYGVVLFYSDYNKIFDNNVIDNNQCGIYLETCSYNNITNNYIDGQPYNGIGLWNSSNNNYMSKNTIINNEYTGIRMLWTANNTVIKNTITHNSVGIRVEYSPNTLVSKNNFIKNKGLEAYFVGNTFLKNNYTFKNNYWNRPRILPKTILGFIGEPNPIIPWITIDWQPARKLIDITNNQYYH